MVGGGGLQYKNFHRIAVANRRRNFIESVEVNGEEEVEGQL